MIEQKRYSGVLNKDDGLTDVLPHQHISAKNIRFVGGQNGLTAQNIKGNVVVPNGVLPAGINECIGAFYDQVRDRILWFNRNSLGLSALYQFSIQTGLITPLFRCGVNSSTDIFGFSLDYPVTSAAIVYSDSGDLLYWTDGNSQPKYLNLDTIASLGVFTADMITANKNWPSTPPTVGYLNDATRTINNLQKKLFQFAYLWQYKNNEKSTSSPYSVVPIPHLPYEPNQQNDPTKNNGIRITVLGGGNDYQAIEIWGRECIGEQFGDFFLIDSLDRDEYNISPGASFDYDFYNDGAYPTIPTEQSDLYFSWIPDKANALELLNGNVLIYAGNTNGYDKLERSDIDIAVTTANGINFSSLYGFKWRWKTPQRLGLIYFDDRGKTNGVISFVSDAVDTTDFVVTTPDYSLSGGIAKQPAFLDASINNLPPSWATSFQWVRAALTPKFLQYVTCDYQTDGTYAYLCIENLYYFKSKNPGFLPSYDFTEGDRVMILGSGTNGIYAAYDLQLDIEILGVVDRTMGAPNPAQNGKFLKINLPTTLPTGGFTQRMYIDIYTPILKTDDDLQVFYEFGERYAIYESGGVRYHRGDLQDQTASQPATFRFWEGDVYHIARQIYEYVNAPNTIWPSFLGNSFSDFFQSNVNSNGRAWVIDNLNENLNETYYNVQLRWGKAYQQQTEINELNIFRPNDYDDADRAKGDIKRLKARDRLLRVFQQRGCAQYGVYSRFIQNNEGIPELVTTNEILTKNNIQYYQGIYGIGDYSTNLASSHIADYFTDIITGRDIRLSVDGITDLGMLYKGQFYFPDWVLPYNKTITRSNGSTSKVMKYFDTYDNDCHTILQAGSLGGISYAARHYSFNETRNGFLCDDYDFKPEWALSAAGVTYTWNEGQLYKHDSSTYCNFYGTQFNSELQVVFNSGMDITKTFISLKEIASSIWECPLIFTNSYSYGTQRQESNLIDSDFVVLEGNPAASFLRDSWSIGGVNNGDSLKGTTIAITFRKRNASNLITLSAVDLYFIDSPLNIK